MTRLLAALVLLALPAQELVVHVRVSTPEGHVVAGLPSITSVKLESSMGTVELQLANLASIKLEGDKAVVTGADRTVLKGRLLLDEIKVTGFLGNLTLKKGAYTNIEIVKSVPFPAPRPVSPQVPVMVHVKTLDGNELNGNADSGTLACESTLGKFDIDIARVEGLSRGKEGHIVMLLDGTRLHAKVGLSNLTVRTGMGVFTLKLENIDYLMNRGSGMRDRRPPAGPPAPAPQGPPAPVNTPSKPADVEPKARTRSNAMFSPLRLSKDGTKAYSINRSDGKLVCWKLPGLEEEGSVALTGVEKTLALDPAGARLFAAGEKCVSVISSSTFTLQKSFSVEIPIDALCALDGDTLVAAGGYGTALISVPKTAVLQKFMGSSSPLLIQIGNQIHAGSSTFLIARDASGTPRLEQFQDSRMSYSTPIPTTVSSDGRYGCSSQNWTVLRLGKCWVASRVVVKDIEAHLASAFSPDNSRLFLFTNEGFLKILDTQEFKLQASHYLGIKVTHAVTSTDGKSVVVNGSALETQGGFLQRGETTTGDLYRFEIPK